jgi:ATP-binding cassette subfamily C protein
MRVLEAFIRSYPKQSAAVLLALLVAGTVEGASLSALLPMLAVAMRGGVGEAAAEDHVSRTVIGAIERMGLTPSLGLLLAVVVGGFAARSAIVLVAKRHVGYTVARFSTDLRLELLRSLLAARWEYFLRQPVGRLANAMSSEVDRSSRAYFHGAALVATGIQFLVTASVALWVSWQATLVYLACSAAVVVLLHRLIRTARRAGRKQTRLLSAMMIGVTDSLQSVKSLKSMAREASADAFIAGTAEGVNTALRRQVLAKESLKAVQQPVFAILVGIGAYAGLQILQLPAGTVIVLLALLVRMLGNVGKMQAEYQNVATCESAYWAVRSTIDGAEQQVEPRSGTLQPTLEREIRLVGVHFGYDEKPVLSGLDMSIPRPPRWTW